MAAERYRNDDDDDIVEELQWGRDRMAAERVREAPLGRRGCCFNGAATGWPRNDDVLPVARVVERASMGPRPDGRGTPPPSPFGCRPGCFNGAATGWPRNASNSSADRDDRDASMGPRPDGRGTRPGSAHRRRRPAASMGPRPDGRGTLEGWAPLACQISFNGAATGWPRNGGGADFNLARRAGFNGAATGWPRNVCSPRPNIGRPLRFNGAATGWPRNALPFENTSRAYFASMGPRPDGRGTIALQALSLVVSKASMGPRPDGRGTYERVRPNARYSGASMGPRPDGRGTRHAAHQRLCPHAPASMGPRPDGRGTGFESAKNYARIKLQWGRDRMAAERSQGPLDQEVPDVLQWGRDRMAAERSDRTTALSWQARFNGAATGWPRNDCSQGARVPRRRASMGPRPDGRGTCPWCVWSRPYRRLQWGRDRMAAERMLTPMKAVISIMLQWGRDRMAAERRHRRVDVRQRLASMGPRPDGRGTRIGRTSPLTSRNGFNGAATGWPRNAAPPHSGGMHATASMGPRPDGRGTV